MPCLLLYLTHGAGSTDHHSFQTAYARSVTSGNCSGEHCMSTRLTDGLPRWLGKHYSWVCLWVCLWKRLTYESIDWVKMTAFPNVSRHYQSIEGLSKTKRWEKGAFFLCLSWDIIFSCSWSLAFGLIPGLRPLAPDSQAFELELNDTTDFPGFLPCRCQTVGLLCIPNHVSQLL